MIRFHAGRWSGGRIRILNTHNASYNANVLVRGSTWVPDLSPPGLAAVEFSGAQRRRRERKTGTRG